MHTNEKTTAEAKEVRDIMQTFGNHFYQVFFKENDKIPGMEL